MHEAFDGVFNIVKGVVGVVVKERMSRRNNVNLIEGWAKCEMGDGRYVVNADSIAMRSTY